jgi:hypothetical protein
MTCGEPERTTSVYELRLAIGIFTFNGSWVWRTNDVTIWAHNNCTVRKGCKEKQKYTFMKVKISNFPSRALAWPIHSGYNAASNCGMFVWKRHHWQGCGLFQDTMPPLSCRFLPHNMKNRVRGIRSSGLSSNAGSRQWRQVNFTFNRL